MSKTKIFVGLLVSAMLLFLVSCGETTPTTHEMTVNIPENFSFVYTDYVKIQAGDGSNEENQDLYEEVFIDFNNFEVIISVSGVEFPQLIGNKLTVVGPKVSEDGILRVSDFFIDNPSWAVQASYTFVYDNGVTKLTSDPIEITAYRSIESAEVVGNFATDYFTTDDFALLNVDAKILVNFVGDYQAEIFDIDAETIDLSIIDMTTPGSYDVYLKHPVSNILLTNIDVNYRPEPNYILEVLLLQANSVTLRASVEGLLYGISGTIDGEIQWQESPIFGNLDPNTTYYFHTYFLDSILYGTTAQRSIETTTTKYTYLSNPILEIDEIGTTFINFKEELYPTTYVIDGIIVTPTKIENGIVYFDNLAVNSDYTIEAYFNATNAHYESTHTVYDLKTSKYIGVVTEVGFGTSTSVVYNGQNRLVGYITNTYSLPVSAFFINYYDADNKLITSGLRNAGQYSVEVICTLENYSFPVYNGFLEITPRNLTYEISDINVVYGDVIPAIQATLTSGTVITNDDLGISFNVDNLPFAEIYHAGSYIIDATASNQNYLVSFITGDLNVSKKIISIQFANLEFPYTASIYNLSYSLDGVLSGDQVLIQLTHDELLEAGTYEVIAESLNNDYEVVNQLHQVSIIRTVILGYSEFEGLEYDNTEKNPSPTIENYFGLDTSLIELILVYYLDGDVSSVLHAGSYVCETEVLYDGLTLSKSSYVFTVAPRGIIITFKSPAVTANNITTSYSKWINQWYDYDKGLLYTKYLSTGTSASSYTITNMLTGHNTATDLQFFVITENSMYDGHFKGAYYYYADSNVPATANQTYNRATLVEITSKSNKFTQNDYYFELIDYNNASNAYFNLTHSSITIRLDEVEVVYGDIPICNYTVLTGSYSEDDDFGIIVVPDSLNVGTTLYQIIYTNSNYYVNGHAAFEKDSTSPAKGTLNILPAELTVKASEGAGEYFDNGEVGFTFKFVYEGLKYTDNADDVVQDILFDVFVVGNVAELKIREVILKNGNLSNYYIPENYDFPSVFIELFELEVVPALMYDSTDEAMYKVGNANPHELALIKSMRNNPNIVFTYNCLEGNVSAVFSGNFVQFSGSGIVEITGQVDDVKFNTVKFYVVDQGKNIHNGSELGGTVNGIVVFHDNILAVSQITVGSSGIIYGNNYELKSHAGIFGSPNGAFIYLSGKLDSVKVMHMYVDKLYTTNGAGGSHYLNSDAIQVLGNNVVIDNCYIEGGENALRYFVNAGNTLVKNTTIKGGVISVNIECTGDMLLTFQNLTIIQLPEPGKNVGAGFVIYDNAKPRIKFVGNLDFRTFVSQDTMNYLSSEFKMAFNKIWQNNEIKKINYNGIDYIHYVALVLGAAGYDRIDFSESNYGRHSITEFVQSMNFLSINANATAFIIDPVLESEYLISLLEAGYLTNPGFDGSVHSPVEPVAVGTGRRIKFNFLNDTDYLTINLENKVPVSFKLFGVDLNYTLSFEYINGTGDGWYSYSDGYLAIKDGKCWLNVIYTVYDSYLGIEYKYVNTLYFNVELPLPTITITPKNLANTVSYLDSALPNPSNFDLTNVSYMKLATKVGYTSSDRDAYYYFQLVTDFDVQSNYYDESGRLVNLLDYTRVVYKGVINQPETMMLLNKQNMPNNLSDKTARFAAVFTIQLIVEYEGQQSVIQFNLIYYVNALTGESWG